jgi:UDP-N-acetylmuramoyl-L-alanyl-D-glutamate--2,6-diaminopimelate ligase
LVKDLEGAELTGDGEIEIENIDYDSRLVQDNSLFIAVRGFKLDGYDFVNEARERGAVAVLGESDGCEEVANHVRVEDARRAMAAVAAKFYGYPGMKIKACGVTGTNGKTTTCHLIKSILEARKKTVGMITTQVYDTGRERFKADRTTPESLDLQRLLLLMKKNYCVNAVIEASSHALALHRLDYIDFRTAVFTNFTRDHLDFHGTMENYLAAKASLLTSLGGSMNYAVINLDVEEFRPFFGDLKSSFLSYSFDNRQADVYCGDSELRPDGSTFDIVTPLGARTVQLKMCGRFNIMNALAAAAAGLASGVDLDSTVSGLEAVAPVPGRFNPLVLGQPFAVYIDYAHTPDAIERLCETAREMTEGRLLILFGCGGDRDRGKRSLMGEAAVKGADYAVVTSDNPRSEAPARIIEDIKPGLEGGAYRIEEDRKKAIRAILGMAEAGDTVLLAGKGAEPYQEIKDVREPFSDADEARAVLAELGYKPSASREET